MSSLRSQKGGIGGWQSVRVLSQEGQILCSSPLSKPFVEPMHPNRSGTGEVLLAVGGDLL
jgi:hypothetical protein